MEKTYRIFESDRDILTLGDRATLFLADTSIGKIKMSDYIGKWLILFSYAGDFTPVGTLFVELKISN